MTKSQITFDLILNKLHAVLLPSIILILLVSCAGRKSGPKVVSTTESGVQRTSADVAAEKALLRKERPWFLVATVNGERNYKVYIDTSTIDTIEGDVMSWSKLVFDADQKDSDDLIYREVMIASAINCEKNTYMYMSSKFYDSLGKMVYMENIENKKNSIEEGTLSETVAKFVCGYEPPDGKVTDNNSK